MRKTIIIAIVITLATSSFAQTNNYREKIYRYTNTKNSDSVFYYIEKWRLETPDNADMYIALADYYLDACQTSISAQDTTEGAVQEYIYGYNDPVVINNSVFNLAQETILEGIKKNPNRIDLYQWRFNTLLDKGEMYDHIDEIYSFIKTDSIIKSRWLFDDYTKVTESENYFLTKLTLIVRQMAEQKGYVDNNLHNIMLKLLKQYPKYIYCHFYLGAIESGNRNWSKAIEYYSNCYNMAGNITVNYKTYNMGTQYGKPIYAYILAETYFETKNYNDALKYYRKAKRGNIPHEYKKLAKIRIKYLKNKLKELKDKDAA